jgi:SAM-dependent methyltransferase
MENNFEIKKCRSCGSIELIPIISLGNQYIVNFTDNIDEKAPNCPLELVLCNNCKLLQLKHNAPANSMWGKQYWYKSGINRMIREDLKDIVENIKNKSDLNNGDIIIDIGCNDGTMLEFYDNPKLNLIGFEPSENVAREASSKGLKIINNFFNAKNFKEEFGDKKAKVITAISMFYDLENPNEFLKDIISILDPNGLLVIQQNYLVTMLENNAFDNICHEHREYYSYYSLKKLLDKYNLETFDITLNSINGGSIRTYIKFKDSHSFKNNLNESNKRISEIVKREEILSLDTEKPYKEFASRIEHIKRELINFLKKEKDSGKTICALGASTRGLVLLQYFELGPNLIKCIFDRNPDKEGKLAVGSWIPITSPDNINKYNPDYQLVLIWHIFKGIGEDEKEFIKRGGKFILPLPQLKIVSNLD